MAKTTNNKTSNVFLKKSLRWKTYSLPAIFGFCRSVVNKSSFIAFCLRWHGLYDKFYTYSRVCTIHRCNSTSEVRNFRNSNLWQNLCLNTTTVWWKHG